MNHTLKDNQNDPSLGWKACPFCGAALPDMKDLRFCTECGIDLKYLKENKKLPPNFLERQHTGLKDSTDFYYSQTGKEKLSDDEIINTPNKKLWSTFSSIGLTIAAIFIMNFIAVAIILPFAFFSPSIESFINSLSSPYFLVITSFAELILIIVPVLYVKKYLRNPSIKNRFALLGITKKNMSTWRFIKEILLGLIFSVIGIILVLSVSFLVEGLVELIFGIDIVREVSSSSQDIDIIIFGADFFGLMLLILSMIFIIGTSEEILFRGFMQKGLVRTIGKKWGMLITALIFTFIHLIGSFLLYDIFSLSFLVSFILSFFPYLAISYLLGFLYNWRKENLIAVMIMHGFYDALTVLLVFLLFNLGF